MTADRQIVMLCEQVHPRALSVEVFVTVVLVSIQTSIQSAPHHCGECLNASDYATIHEHPTVWNKQPLRQNRHFTATHYGSKG